MNRLIPVTKTDDILPALRGTPAGLLFEYHNLGRPFDNFQSAELLVAMCMDNRKYLHIPDNFAFIIRTGGANLRASEFKVSYAVAIGKVKQVVLMAHSQCGMVNLISRKDEFIRGLVERGGWTEEAAEDHFFHFAPIFEIGNEVDFVISETKRLRLRYPGVPVIPMYYKIEDNLLYQIREG